MPIPESPTKKIVLINLGASRELVPLVTLLQKAVSLRIEEIDLEVESWEAGLVDQQPPDFFFICFAIEKFEKADAIKKTIQRTFPRIPIMFVRAPREDQQESDLFYWDGIAFSQGSRSSDEGIQSRQSRPEDLAPSTSNERLRLKQFVGESSALLKLTQMIPKVAQSDATVMISGETGTGKELVARAIHSLSARNEKQSVTKTDNASGVVLQMDTYSYADALERSYTMTDIAGRTTSYTYDCCNLDSLIDPDGVQTEYAYDLMKRRIASSVYYGGTNAITTSNILDGVGNVLQTQRIGTNGNIITLQTAGYDVLSRVIFQTNALGGVTQTAYSGDGVPLVMTNTNPDGGTQVISNFADGRMQSVTGTAVMPVQHNYGLATDGGTNVEYTQTIKLNSSGGTNEWFETFADAAGRIYKKLYNVASGSNPTEQTAYGVEGVVQQVDADGVTTQYGYYIGSGNINNGQLDYTTNDPVNLNMVSQVIRTVLTSGSRGNRVAATNYQFLTAQTSGTAVFATETSASTLTNWSTVYSDGVTPVVTTRVTSPGTTRTQSVTNADGSYTISVYSYSRLASLTKYTSSGTVISETTYGYDSHGRQSTVTDGRNGTTTYTFNNADQVSSVTTPDPQSVASAPETTSTTYDTSMRAIKVTYADGTSLTNTYFPTSLVQSNFGSRVYPASYSYDAQGRMLSMTNWTNFSSLAGARATTWIYDPYRGFLTNKTDVAGEAVSYTYTAAGRLASRKWARGTNTTYQYNTAGLVGTNYYSDGTPGVTNTYDRLGRKTSVVSGATTTSFVYDLANDVLSESYSGGTLGGLLISNKFDADLRRTNVTLFNGASVLCQTTNGYDAASRFAVVSDGTNNATYSYLANSSLVGQIVFSSNTVTRMTTSKQYDFLNRLTSISSTASNSYGYLYNAADQRTMTRLADSSYWNYNYDSLGQVISGNKYWVDETPVAGQQFDYTFDTIGNRVQTQTGGDLNGANLRVAYYTNNSINEITGRTVPAYVDIMGIGIATNPVTVNGTTAYRENEYFRQQLGVTNTNAAVWDGITITNGGTTNTGHLYVAETPELYTYDADGNVLSDGRWNYTWDGENRLLSMTSLSGAPSGSLLQLNFTYDYQSRRIQKLVSTNNGTNYVGEYTNKYAYDQWNCLASMSPTFAMSNSFLWGTDLSGTPQGAGGVGGLLAENTAGSGVAFVAYDGNGNVSALVSASNGATIANYEYGPFGELIRATGPMAKLNPFRFSTKYDDDETDLLYYGYRYYNPSTGRWLSRDPLGEEGGMNLYAFVSNDPSDYADLDGLIEIPFTGIQLTGCYNYNVSLVSIDNITIVKKPRLLPASVAISRVKSEINSMFPINGSSSCSGTCIPIIHIDTNLAVPPITKTGTWGPISVTATVSITIHVKAAAGVCCSAR